ncbi:ankyrin repeat domain-containing protein [Bdellovibrio sp. HCB337]|uniref:ankyrin repeat domain-containing protein n=1 Tax=Bdellovibrio sp. HCB337 TaxID=3394358 RepID=UPI0039A63626
MNFSILYIALIFLSPVSLYAAKESSVITETHNNQLIKAAQNRDLAKIKDLIKTKAKLNIRDSKGRTALLIATENDDVEIARALVKAGADVNLQDDKLDSPLLYAGAAGRLEILKLILADKPNFKVYNRYGGTALIPACERGHVDVVKELLKTKIDINHVNKLGWTGLMEAIVLSDGGPKHQEIVQLLVDAGADLNIPDRDGVTPLEHAKRRGYKEIVKILEKAHAK